MRWEEFRQIKGERFCAEKEAKEREWMQREDPRIKHEAEEMAETTRSERNIDQDPQNSIKTMGFMG